VRVVVLLLVAIASAAIARAASADEAALSSEMYVEAWRAFEGARRTHDDAERLVLFRRAAELYAHALETAPARDEAPEAAINGGYAYRQLGEYASAIALYERFITEYGSDARFARVAADPKRKAERVRYLAVAHEALESAYVASFDVAAAARHDDALARDERFAEETRRNSAANAVVLHAALRERDAMVAASHVLARLSPPPDVAASSAFVVARYDLGSWSAFAPDEGDNRRARIGAERDLAAFHDAHARVRGAEAQVFEAACDVARLKRAAGERDARTWADKARAALARVDAARAHALEERATACRAAAPGVLAALAPSAGAMSFAVTPP
jgi:hypothetical protein